MLFRSQELRVYSWLLALSLLSAVLLLRALDGRLKWRWYALAAGVFVNMHYFACFVLATHAVWVLLNDRRRSTIVAWVVAAVGGCLMFAPWLLYAAPAMTDDNLLPFVFPAVGGKRVIADFDGGRLTSDGGVMLLSLAERRLAIAERLARCFRDGRDAARQQQQVERRHQRARAQVGERQAKQVHRAASSRRRSNFALAIAFVPTYPSSPMN